MASAKMNKKCDEENAENIDRKETLKFKYENEENVQLGIYFSVCLK